MLKLLEWVGSLLRESNVSQSHRAAAPHKSEAVHAGVISGLKIRQLKTAVVQRRGPSSASALHRAVLYVEMGLLVVSTPYSTSKWAQKLHK